MDNEAKKLYEQAIIEINKAREVTKLAVADFKKKTTNYILIKNNYHETYITIITDENLSKAEINKLLRELDQKLIEAKRAKKEARNRLKVARKQEKIAEKKYEAAKANFHAKYSKNNPSQKFKY